jgi:multidrug transporter EmrE-like cation transporter
MQVWVYALTSILLSSAGQLLLKQGLNAVKNPDMPAVAFLVAALTNLQVLAGLFAYGSGAIVWLLALRQTQLSLLYPLVSLSYVAVAAGSVLFLGESLPMGRIVGIAVIMAGVVLVARS